MGNKPTHVKIYIQIYTYDIYTHKATHTTCRAYTLPFP